MSGALAKEVVEIECHIVRETEKAILVELPTAATQWKKTEWFPLSQVESIHRSEEGEGDYIVVKKWIAEKKGLV